MSSKNAHRKLGRLLHDEMENLAGMTEPPFQVAANLSSGVINSDHFAPSSFLDDFIDPTLLSLSNSDMVAPDIAQETSTRLRTTSPHAVNHDTGARHQLRNKKQRECGTRVNKISHSTATRKARGRPETEEPYEYSTRVASFVNGHPRIRWIHGYMEWYDDEDKQWKPARYHHDIRMELIKLAEQQPGAPIWTPDLGTNYTSFSPLTQGWTEDPTSVVDSKGRQVFLMKQPPAEWRRKAVYNNLMYDGFVILDDKDRPVRDIPGLPLTLDTRAPPWFLAGLRRSLDLEVKDLEARRPDTRETASGTRKAQGYSALTTTMNRWLMGNGFEIWYPRPNAQKRRRESVEGHNLQRSVAVRKTNPAPVIPEQGPCSSHQNYSPLPSWDTSTSAQFGDVADTGLVPMAYPDNSTFGLQNTPAYDNHCFGSADQGKRNMLGGNGLSQDTQMDYTGMPVPWSDLERYHTAFSGVSNIPPEYGFPSNASSFTLDPEMLTNPAYNNGYQETFPLSTNAVLFDTAYTPSSIIDFPTPPKVDPDNQMTLFPGGDFHHTIPRNPAEANFIKAALEYTSAEYRYWMSAEPPQSSPSQSYAEQYRDMQTHLEQAWPFPNEPPVKLRAIGPVSGGLDQL